MSVINRPPGLLAVMRAVTDQNGLFLVKDGPTTGGCQLAYGWTRSHRSGAGRLPLGCWITWRGARLDVTEAVLAGGMEAHWMAPKLVHWFK